MLKKKRRKVLHVAKIWQHTLGEFEAVWYTMTLQLRSIVLSNGVYLGATLGNKGVQSLHLRARPHGN